MFYVNFSSTRSNLFGFSDRNISFFSLLQQKTTLIAIAIVSAIAIVFFALKYLKNPKIKAKLKTLKVIQNKGLEEQFKQIIAKTPQFVHYKVGLDTKYESILTGVTLRPANFFFHALFDKHKKNSQGPQLEVTLPGKSKLFAINHPQILNKFIHNSNPQESIKFSANGFKGDVYASKRWFKDVDLEEIYGDKTYEISFNELQKTLNSQKIFLSPTLPLKFYRELKASMVKDGIVTLPGHDGNPVKLKDINSKHCKELLAEVQKNPQAYGFKAALDCSSLFDLTLYQIGSMVVKVEEYHIFMDGAGKIIERSAGQMDAIQLINACGIRGIRSENEVINKKIMTDTFKTALVASKEGMVVFPAVGMGVWGGDPNLYWRAFLDAVVSSATPLEKLFINPGHQKTKRDSIYINRSGDEFAEILNEYIDHYKKLENQMALNNLNKIVNLFDQETDLIQLAHELKKTYPNKIISLFNASDPDVTLGNHVGEYTNNCPHTSTTEENYTAMGTNGLCFESITNVHSDPQRVVSVSF